MTESSIASTLVSPSFGVTSLALGGFAHWTDYGAIWMTWWLGDIAGDLVIAPLVVLWGTGPSWNWNRQKAAEVGVLLLLLLSGTDIQRVRDDHQGIVLPLPHI